MLSRGGRARWSGTWLGLTLLGLTPGPPLFGQRPEPHHGSTVSAQEWVDGTGRGAIPPTGIGAALARRGTVLWVDARDPDPAAATLLARQFNLPPATAAAVLEPRRRPIVRSFTGLVLFSLPTPRLTGDRVQLEPLNLVLGRGYLLVVRWGDLPALEEARGRWKTLPPAARRRADQLGGTMLDAVLATYAPALEQTTDRLEEVQLGIFRDGRNSAPRELVTLKQAILAMRRVLYPLPERLTELRSATEALYPGAAASTLVEAGEEAHRLRDELDLQSEAVGDAMDAHLAETSNRLARAMNLLTVLGVCLAVMGAVFGAWGMNFEVIPIAKHRWGFWLVFALIAILCGSLLIGTRLVGIW